ncbi:MAG: CYTH domain-containing protein [Planctomycetota bacterium]
MDDATHIEIERKYLLDGLPELPPGARATRIEQGYLPLAPAGEAMQGRIRREVDAGGAVRCTHTIKRGEGMRREETEREIAEEVFRREWQRTVGRLTKTRHRVDAGTLVWEIDAFHEHDLVLAEIELPAEDTAFEIPAWLAPHMVREVTDDTAYRNASIAINGPP